MLVPYYKNWRKNSRFIKQNKEFKENFEKEDENLP
jgi:hypothetical protein